MTDLNELRQIANTRAEEIEYPADLKEALDAIDAIVAYRIKNKKSVTQDGSLLNRQLILRDYGYVLERHHTDAETKYTIAINYLTEHEDMSNAKAERLADEAFPLASFLRRRIRAAKNVADGVTSQLSFLKAEINNLSR